MKPLRYHPWRYHLSVAVLIIPILWAGDFLHTFSREGIGVQVFETKQIGPWTATLAEKYHAPPYRDPSGTMTKDFAVRFCEGCIDQFKAAYLKVGKPRSVRAAGAMLGGAAYAMEAHVQFPPKLEPNDTMWLTIEGWDGKLHQVSWPLTEITK